MQIKTHFFSKKLSRNHRLEIETSSLHDAGDYTFVPEGYSQSLSARLHIIGIEAVCPQTQEALFPSLHSFMLYSTDPPRVHLEGLNFPDNTVTIVAGNKLRLEIPISGEPAPRVVWMKGERVGYNPSSQSKDHKIAFNSSLSRPFDCPSCPGDPGVG